MLRLSEPRAFLRSCLSPLLALVVALPTLAAAPHRSYERLVSSNGFAVASYDVATRRIDTFLEHPYRFRQPRPGDVDDLCFGADETRDLAFDAYFGVRSGSGAGERGEWLPALSLLEHGYEAGTGILHAAHAAGADGQLRVDTWSFVPMALERPVLVQLARVRNDSGASVPASVYALYNFHLGNAAGGREPSSSAEQVSAAGAAVPAFTLYEYSDESEGTMAYVALTPLAHHEVSTAAGGVYSKLGALADLNDVSSTSGAANDVVPGFQGAAVELAPAGELWFASAVVWAGDSDAQADVEDTLAWWSSRTPSQVLDAERAAWSAWHTTPPVGLDVEQTKLWRQSAAFLRMGQVREPGGGFGQILASLPPGDGDVNAQWNISWVRDMAYAVVGLARAGHLEEAWSALAFQLQAGPGKHTAVVGDDYRISITRYFGDGSEESDCNEDGPNIEYDGFGLFLWSLGEYVRAGGAISDIAPFWPVIEGEIADVLISLLDDDGVVRADSSIWEVHWNGNERRFTYTSLAATAGLCELASLAGALGHHDDAARFSTAGARVRDAVVTHHTDATGVLAQSREDLLSGSQYIDAATVEAINWGVIDPAGAVADATLDALLSDLVVDGSPGIMRNDDGGWYDSQEWVFVDLRLIPALVAAGEVSKANELITWLEGHALLNDLQLAELQEETTADYAGSIPMVGFGAGAYLIARSPGAVLPPACGSYASEPLLVDSDAGAADGGLEQDAGGDGDGDAGDVSGPDAGEPPLDDAGDDVGVDAGAGDEAGPPAHDDAGQPGFDAGTSLNDGGDDRPPAMTDGGAALDDEDGCSCVAAGAATSAPSTATLLWLGLFVISLAGRRSERRSRR